MWDVAANAPVTGPLEFNEPVSAGAINASGTRIAIAWGKFATVLDASTGRTLFVAEHPARVLDVAFSADERLLATGAADSIARIWSVTNGNPVIELKHDLPLVRTVGFSADGRKLLTSTRADQGLERHISGEVRLWDLSKKHEVWVWSFSRDADLRRPVFSNDGKMIAVPAGDLAVCDAASGHPLAEWPSEAIIVAQFDRLGDRLLAGGNRYDGDAEAHVFKLEPGKQNGYRLDELRDLDLPTYTRVLQGAALSPDGALVATITEYDSNLVNALWDVRDGSQVLNFATDDLSVYPPPVESAVAYSNDGAHVAVSYIEKRSGQSNYTKVWTVAPRK